MDNESRLAVGFPFPLPLSFPFAVSHAFLAQSCCVWALICQAVINSKKNLFLLNYFWNVMQTCLNYVAANSALRSGFDFMWMQVGERKKETRTQNGDMALSKRIIFVSQPLTYNDPSSLSEGWGAKATFQSQLPLMEYTEGRLPTQFSRRRKAEISNIAHTVRLWDLLK